MADNTLNFDLDAPAVPTLTLDPTPEAAEEKKPDPAPAAQQPAPKAPAAPRPAVKPVGTAPKKKSLLERIGSFFRR